MWLRTVYGLADDPVRQRLVLLGGSQLVWSGSLPETWEWDGQDWTQRQPLASPEPGDWRGGDRALTYDAARQRVTLFDGFNTWRWVP